jgi:hypothetical protein
VCKVQRFLRPILIQNLVEKLNTGGPVKFLFDLINRVSPKKRIKVGWLLLGDVNTGSSRIHGLNIHRFLCSKGVESVIVQTSAHMTNTLTLSPEEQERVLSSGFDVLLFQKVRDEKAQQFARAASGRGIRTVFIQCDCIDTQMVSAVDQVVVTSQNLCDYYRSHYGIEATVIQDAVEVDTSHGKQHRVKSPLTLIWVGYSDNWESVGMVRDVLDSMNDNDFVLKTISNHPEADVPWDLATVSDEILQADIGVIPAHLEAWGLGKSNNRLTMFMALGMPVVASPVPSYLDIIRQGRNGFLARSQEEWTEALLALKSVETRSAVGKQARLDSFGSFGLNTIGPQWLNLLRAAKGKGAHA